MSGGANKGSWEAGVLNSYIYSALNATGSAEDFEYDVLSGISIGSMNSLMLSGFPIG